MNSTLFFIVTTLLEIGAGLALLLAPALVMRMVFGPSSDIQTGVAIGRIAGAALLSLGAACWWARHDVDSTASRALVSGLLIYNAAIVVLVLSRSLGSLSPLLWAVVVVHGTMTTWCVRLLRGRPVSVRV